MSGVHPIEIESYRILHERVDLRHLGPGGRVVVERVIHASADLDYASTMVVDEAAVAAGVAAIAAGAPIVTDVEMTRSGLTGAGAGAGAGAHCFLGRAKAEGDLTRSAAGIRMAAAAHPEGAVIVIGCAPTALVEVVRLHAAGLFHPALVVGLPVGFVGAAESKALLRQAPIPSISNLGEKGGSAVAAAAVNAMTRMAANHGC